MNTDRAWLALAIVAGVGLALQVLAPPDFSSVPESSFDTAPRGNAGLFELLTRFELTKGRWVSGLSMPSESEAVWFVAPSQACEYVRERTEQENEAALPEAPGLPFEVTVRPWVEAGGTALVWLSHPPLAASSSESSEEKGASKGDGAAGEEADRAEGAAGEEEDQTDGATDEEENDAESFREELAESLAELRNDLENGEPQECPGLLGERLPPRSLHGLEGGALPNEGRYSPIVFSVGRATADPEAFDYEAARTLPGPTLAFFDRLSPPEATADQGEEEDAPDPWAGWSPLWVEADTRAALAISREIGEGRLVVISDARLVSNTRLADGDAAPFAMDAVREFGVPWIDEHSHGVVAEVGTFRYLLNSPARAACLGLLGLGVLVLWRGRAWPRRDVDEADAKAPTLGDYVDSVAQLYGQSQDHRAIFERYRGVSLERIRRALGLSPGTSSEIVLASLRSRAENWPALAESGLGHLLTKEIPIGSAEDLDRNASRLDELVRVVRASGRVVEREERI